MESKCDMNGIEICMIRNRNLSKMESKTKQNGIEIWKWNQIGEWNGTEIRREWNRNLG